VVAQVAAARDHGMQHAANAAMLGVDEADELAVVNRLKKLFILDAGCAQFAVTVKVSIL